MYCKTCGFEGSDQMVACPKCGVNPRAGNQFCANCGTSTSPNQIMCVSCGTSLKERQPATATASSDKTAAIVAYIPVLPIGIIAGIVLHNSNKTAFGAYHLRQSLGLNVTAIVFWILMSMVNAGNPMRMYGNNSFTMLGMLALFVLFILGMVSAYNGQEKPIPLLGNYFQKWFAPLFV